MSKIVYPYIPNSAPGNYLLRNENPKNLLTTYNFCTIILLDCYIQNETRLTNNTNISIFDKTS
jgi:hypothetical protein